MTQHDDVAYLGHMLDMARTARRLTEGVPREQFDKDEGLQLAVTRALEIIGEAARRVSTAGRATLPGIARPSIISMRHRLAHDYFDIDLDVVWDTVTHNVPDLINALASVVPPEPLS
jgi:uncharacterized protein with HEPN domain